jgi:hypothetical protein
VRLQRIESEEVRDEGGEQLRQEMRRHATKEGE